MPEPAVVRSSEPEGRERPAAGERLDAGGSPASLIPLQSAGPRPDVLLGPAVIAGKGVRMVRCVGCSRDTLPRGDDGAPLCIRCSELLAATEADAEAGSASAIFRAPRWMRRRQLLA